MYTYFRYDVVSVRNGYSCVPVALSEGLDIRLGTAVTDIQYGGPGVTVKAVNPRNQSQPQVFKGKLVTELVKNFSRSKWKIQSNSIAFSEIGANGLS